MVVVAIVSQPKRRDQMLQGDAYTGNWLSAIRHTPKLARRMIVSTMSLVAELYPDKTHVLYGPRHAVIHCNTLPHCNNGVHSSVCYVSALLYAACRHAAINLSCALHQVCLLQVIMLTIVSVSTGVSMTNRQCCCLATKLKSVYC